MTASPLATLATKRAAIVAKHARRTEDIDRQIAELQEKRASLPVERNAELAALLLDADLEADPPEAASVSATEEEVAAEAAAIRTAAPVEPASAAGDAQSEPEQAEAKAPAPARTPSTKRPAPAPVQAGGLF